MHPRDFLWLPPYESARLAARIPGARFLLIDGNLPLGDARQGVAAIETFLDGLSAPDEPAREVATAPQSSSLINLSLRQKEVLRLIAQGKTTREIADTLVLSERTVERHIADAYAKIGARNRSEATVYALGNLVIL
jgi:DNA-binding NarL/FixJ family response regulator